jgi:hypothetical protein
MKPKSMRWVGHVASMGNKLNGYRVLDGKPEGKRLLGRHRRRWEDDMKMDLVAMEWTTLLWLRIGELHKRHNELSGSMKCWRVLE